MSLYPNPRFDDLSKEVGPFAATMIIANTAVGVCDSLQERISASTAISYIVDYKDILPENFPDHRLDYVQDYLEYIIDSEVQDAVLESYRLTLKYGNLVYKYLTIDDCPRMARVRILTNFLWDNRPYK